jgi:2-dehydropantoate 2-reductase
MKVAILGCGSLGGVMAARLAGKPQVDLTVIDRDPQIVEAINNKGLILREGRKEWTRPVRLVESGAGMVFDVLILATKAGSLVEAAASLKDNLTPEASVITVQNGLAALDLASVVGAGRLIPGCVLWGASMEAPGQYRITNTGSFILGRLESPPTEANDATMHRVRDLMSNIFPVKCSKNIRGVLWSKLAITTTFTTLGAISGLTFGEMAARGEIRNIMLTIFRELFEVGTAEGIRFEPLSPAMDVERFLSDQGYSRFKKHLLIRILGFKNRHDESSMLASLKQGQKTEIDFINGRLVQSADKLGLSIPYNRLAVDLIKQMESGQLQPKPENIAAFRDLD